jgi:hypothetical protein
MQHLPTPDSTPVTPNPFGSQSGADEADPYAEIVEEVAPTATTPPARRSYADIAALPSDAQDSYFETREPSELIFCIILAAAYAGLARYCWEPLQDSHQWVYFITVEGIFITIAMLSMVLGVRPYLSPSSLQIGKHGIKYRGPYWPQRKTVNWDAIFRLYLSPELIIIFYRPQSNPRGVRLLFIQSSYLSDRNNIVESFAKYALVQPIYMKNPDWYIKAIGLFAYLSIVCWILYMLHLGQMAP